MHVCSVCSFSAVYIIDSAQFMLRRFTLSWLLAADLSSLREKLPRMPDKVLKVHAGCAVVIIWHVYIIMHVHNKLVLYNIL